MGRNGPEHPFDAATQFYLTAPAPCPYLDGQIERKVFTHLAGSGGSALNEALSHLGFRRSQNVVYRPACDDCAACVSVRVLVDGFSPSRSFRRTLARNSDLHRSIVAPTATLDHYDLFRRYLDARHSEGGMADMAPIDYAQMVETGTEDTHLVEYRTAPRGGDGLASNGSRAAGKGHLLGVALTDRLSDGLSMIYSFFDPKASGRGLGTFIILDHIVRARDLGLPHVYLGYWVEGSSKMAYKARFLPQERLIGDGWMRVDEPPGDAGNGAD